MVNCAVSACGVNQKNNPENYTFHRFPLDPIVRDEWLRLIGRVGWTPMKTSTICSKHFLDQYKRKNRINTILVKGAVPTLFVPVHLKERVPSSYIHHDIILLPSQERERSVPLSPRKEERMSNNFKLKQKLQEKQKKIRTLLAKTKRQALKIVALQNVSKEIQSRPGLKDDYSGITMTNPGTSGTKLPSKATSDDDFTWPESNSESDDDKNDSDDDDDESNPSEQFIEHHEIEDNGMLEITEVKIEPPDEVDLNAVKVEPEAYDTILGSDGGVSSGFSPFIRVTATNLPTINMFAIMEFIIKNKYYNTLDYEKLKAMLPPKAKLLSGLRVQHREFVHRVRSTVHLQTSSECGIEYDTNTHTVTRSECMCAYATCEHVAALLMWIHCVSNQKTYKPNLVPEQYNPPKNTKHQPSVALDSKVIVNPAGVPCDSVLTNIEDEVSLSCPDDPLNVPDVSELIPGPPTAKRKKTSPSTPAPASAPGPGTYTMQVFKDKSKPKDTDTKIDESIIKCSFTRKCFFNVWRSTKGNFNEKLRHTRSIMTKAFHDPNYVIDFLPLEKKLEELCMQIEGYWNSEVNKEGFESKYAEWFAAVEHIDMKKTKRGVVLGSSTSFGNVCL